MNSKPDYATLKKSLFVRQGFSEIAKKYDLFNDVITQGMHRLWKNRLVKLAGLSQGDSALDICCGTGDIAQRLANKLGDQAQVIGLDFSSGMLEAAQGRDRMQRVRLVRGDVLKLPFETGSFDAVSVGYGLRNLDDLAAGIAEVKRVLKPGGRFVCLDMGKVTLPVVRQIFKLYYFKAVPVIGRMLYGKAEMFDYFPQSSVHYPSQQRLAEMLSEAGFNEVSYHNLHLGASVIHRAVKPVV